MPPGNQSPTAGVTIRPTAFFVVLIFMCVSSFTVMSTWLAPTWTSAPSLSAVLLSSAEFFPNPNQLSQNLKVRLNQSDCARVVGECVSVIIYKGGWGGGGMLCSRKMFNFLMSKHVRKILKRKDSDAGEKGKALEDLRSSLFNELRSSEGARRYQQRICGPTVALAFNFLVSISIILMNKLVLEKVGFNYPIFLTFIHYAVSWFLMAILNALSMLPASPMKSSQFSSLFALGVVMSLSTGLANVSLKYNSVGFYQMAKVAVTPSIVVAEFILLRKKVSFQKVLALTVVSIGVAVATVTDLQFHLFGACVALAWIIPSAVNKILWSNMQQRENWTALGLMWKTAPITVFFLVVMMPWLDPPGVLSFNWNFRNTSTIFMSAILGFLLQWSGALALGATSATTHVVLGQFKTCVILLGGYILFGSNPGLTSLCGAITALVGMSIYTYLNLHGSDQHSNKTSRQASSSLPKSKLSSENSESHDGNVATESVNI